MAYFNVVIVQTIYEVATVEADTQEQAQEIVLNDTGSLQWDFLDSADWQILEIKEI